MPAYRVLIPALLLALGLSGCVYYNGLYNAREAFESGERARLRGDASAARDAWESAATGAERAWIAEPDGGWADEALLLTARAALRLGDLPRATEALDLLSRSVSNTEVARRAGILRGAVELASGRTASAVARIQRALPAESSATWLGEAHLWLARARFATGDARNGHLELDRAVEVDGSLRRAVALERLNFGIQSGDRSRAGESARLLFREATGSAWADSLQSLADVAAARWGPSDAAALLAPLRDGAWGPDARDRLLLHRTRLMLAAGDSAGAVEELEWIARGSGVGAVDARVRLADVQLALASTFTELVLVRRVLLPISDDARARLRMLRIGEVEALALWGTEDDPVAFFAAGEVARDELGADRLARALFLTASEFDLDGPWSSKSLLAALALTDRPEMNSRIRQQLARRSRDPYVERTRPGYMASNLHEFREAQLTLRLRALRVAATEEAQRFIPPESGATLPAPVNPTR